MITLKEIQSKYKTHIKMAIKANTTLRTTDDEKRKIIEVYNQYFDPKIDPKKIGCRTCINMVAIFKKINTIKIEDNEGTEE